VLFLVPRDRASCVYVAKSFALVDGQFVTSTVVVLAGVVTDFVPVAFNGFSEREKKIHVDGINFTEAESIAFANARCAEEMVCQKRVSALCVCVIAHVDGHLLGLAVDHPGRAMDASRPRVRCPSVGIDG